MLVYIFNSPSKKRIIFKEHAQSFSKKERETVIRNDKRLTGLQLLDKHDMLWACLSDRGNGQRTMCALS